jgi:uncharacterized protein
MPDARPAGGTTRAARWLVVLGLLAAAASAAHAADVPALTGRVVDGAAILTQATREQLTAALAAHERATSNQIAVLTTSTINGEPVEDYANRVFNTWKLGQKGKDNGVLLVVVLRDRKTRIEVGYGLEATLTDAATGRIIDHVMKPRFKAGDYDRGVSDGVTAIVAALEGRPDTTARPAASDRFEPIDMPLAGRIGISLFVFGFIGLFTFAGIMTSGAGGWFLYVFLSPFWLLFPMPFWGVRAGYLMLGIHVVGFPLIRMWVADTDWYRKMQTRVATRATTSSGGSLVTSSSDSSSSDSSSSSSSSDFSGGGGSSGGGGASGSW